MTTSKLISLAGLAAISLTAASFAQTTSPSTPRTSPSTPTRTTPSTSPATTPSNTNQQPTTTTQQPGTTNQTPTNQPPTNQQPGTTNNNPNIPPTVNDPSVQPVLPPNSTGQPIIETPMQPGMIDNTNNRMFAIDPGQEGRFQQLSQRLARLESQLQTSNDRILQELGEARQTADSNTRVDRLAGVMQQLLLQNRMLQQYLMEIRSSLTGQLETDGTGAAGVNGTNRTVPGSISGPSTTSPRRNEVQPSSPGRPTAPIRNPGTGTGDPGSVIPTTPPATGTTPTNPNTPNSPTTTPNTPTTTPRR